MRVPALGVRAGLVDAESEVEQVPREVGPLLHGHTEPFDRAAGLDDGAAGLPEDAVGAGTELALAEGAAEAALLR